MAAAESPQEAARKAMELSVSRQRQAVAAMLVSVEKQRASAIRPGLDQPAAAASAVSEAVPTSFFALSWPALGADCDPLPEVELAPLIQQAAQREGLDAATSCERLPGKSPGSGLAPCPPKGAILGLMQLMPATAQEFGVHDPLRSNRKPRCRVRGSFKQLLARYDGDAALALGAYNAGPERVEESGGVPQIPETIRYVQQILSKLPIP